jgi:hypothetical protein
MLAYPESYYCQNVFWRLENSNPHKTISQDPLHTFHGGLYGHYIHKEAKNLTELLKCGALKQIDKQGVPNVYHYSLTLFIFCMKI